MVHWLKVYIHRKRGWSRKGKTSAKGSFIWGISVFHKKTVFSWNAYPWLTLKI
jgi:hypothetical protein